jgi:glutamine amidotransferase
MNVAIIKYNAGNIHSVRLALERLGLTPQVSDDPEVISKADKVIFPGVGEASSAMQYLKEKELDRLIRSLKQPVLGICLGLQLLCEYSEENDTTCLGIFPVTVKKFPPIDKVPHMGWNSVTDLDGNLFDGVHEDSYVYFVHSYFAELNTYRTATTEYLNPFSAAMQRNNYFAVQFHPEKSSLIGEQILKNFLAL